MDEDSKVPPNPWDEMRQRMRSASRSSAYISNGVWALDVLEGWLSPRWCASMLELESEGPLWGFSSHLGSYCELLELALAARLLKGAAGLDAVRRDINKDLRGARLYHSRLQMSLGARALRAGAQVELEPGEPPTDVRAAFERAVLNVETVTLIRSQRMIDSNRASDEASHSFRVFGHKHGVSVSGKVDLAADWDLSECMEALSQTLVGSFAIGACRTVSGEGFELTVERTDDARGLGNLRYSFAKENAWTRVRSKLLQKAARSQQSGATWVYADVFNGLFDGTAWSQLPQPQRMLALWELLHNDPDLVNALRGVVLSDGAALMRVRPHHASSPVEGTVEVHERLSGLGSRTVTVVALKEGAADELAAWRAIFDHEKPWMEWALEECGLPIPQEFRLAVA